MHTIHVNLPGYEHTITVGQGALGHVGGLIPGLVPGTKAILVTSPGLDALYGDQVRDSLTDLAVYTVLVPDGEAQKTVATLTRIWDGLAQVAAGRKDLLIALGGGVIGDMAGFLKQSHN